MVTQDKRAHGVTPGLRQDYALRTAQRQAAFVLPYLHPGMRLLDAGCGPGSITLGLAKAVAPGLVTGIDHDDMHIQAASALATQQDMMSQVNFQTGSVLSLPFEDGTFDAAFENNVFTHLPADAILAAREIYRVLKPGGLFAARDVDTDSVVWGNLNDSIKQLDRLFTRWIQSRGSDTTIGRRLPEILRRAGFTNTFKSVSADTKGKPDETRSHADITVSLLDGPFGRDLIDRGWAECSTVEHLKEGIREWGEHPDAFFANVHVEVIGWKPE